jgi:hypothetical protein
MLAQHFLLLRSHLLLLLQNCCVHLSDLGILIPSSFFTGNNNKRDDFKRKVPPWKSVSLDLQAQVFSQREAHSKV